MPDDSCAMDAQELARQVRCSTGLARDLLTLAGNDKELVIEASDSASRIEAVKAYIVDARLSKIERSLNDEKDSDAQA